jgi:hypothetical protein
VRLIFLVEDEAAPTLELCLFMTLLRFEKLGLLCRVSKSSFGWTACKNTESCMNIRRGRCNSSLKIFAPWSIEKRKGRVVRLRSTNLSPVFTERLSCKSWTARKLNL